MNNQLIELITLTGVTTNMTQEQKDALVEIALLAYRQGQADGLTEAREAREAK